MDAAQGEFGALGQAGSLLEDDAVLLKSPKVEIPDEQDEDVGILERLKEEEIIIKQDLDVKSCSLTDSESTHDSWYSENLVTNFKTEEIKSEITEERPDLGNGASVDAELLKSPKAEIPDDQHEEEETLLMIRDETIVIEENSNAKSCSFNSESKADTLHSEILVTDVTTLERIKSETSEETPILGNKATGANTGASSRDVIFDPHKTYICNDCRKQFDKKAQLIQHIKSHNTTLNAYFNCHECDYRTAIRDTLEIHLRLHDKTRKHQCDDCGRRFTRNSNLHRHKKTVHSVDKETLKIHSCDVCIYKTSNLCHLNEHLKTHTGEKPFSCHMCTYKCSEKRSFKKDMRHHTGEKPFSCHMCAYKYSRKDHLKRHMRSHTGEKPYSCDMCTYQCSKKRCLTMHMRRHTREKPYCCDMCTYQCSRKGHLKRHMKTHTGEKPFSCHMCTYKCSEKSSLKKHMRHHTGEKPFSCHMCAYKCSRKDHLKRHMRIHTGEKPFSCHMCAHKCSTKSDLNKHMQSHTGDKPFPCSI